MGGTLWFEKGSVLTVLKTTEYGVLLVVTEEKTNFAQKICHYTYRNYHRMA